MKIKKNTKIKQPFGCFIFALEVFDVCNFRRGHVTGYYLKDYSEAGFLPNHFFLFFAASASAAALTAKEVVVGTLTGKINLVTAAQWLWNTAMNANPIGVAIGLVAALAAGIGLLCVALSNGTEDTDLLAEANERMAESIGHIADGIEQWNEKVDNAKSSMEGFNDSILRYF